MRNGKQDSKYLVGNPFAVLIGLSCVLATALPAARADDDARAHAIAERFAGASDEAKKRAETERLQAIKAAAEAKRKSEDAKRRADAERKKTEQMRADEADMLDRARAEAAEREAEQKRAQADRERAEQERLAHEKARADAERIAAETAAATAAAEQARTQAARLAAEKAERDAAEKVRIEKARLDELARAKAKVEAEERAAREAQANADRLAAEKAAAVEAERQAAEQRRIAEAAERAKAALAEAEARQARLAREAELKAEKDRETAIETQRQAEAERQALETEREQEATRLTEKIRKAREARQTAGSEPVTSTPDAPVGSAVHAAGGNASPSDTRRVTVLLMMTAGNKGIRRWNKSADPMLCIAEVCYVSAGPGAAAKRLPRSTAFGPGVALGSRAGACNNSLGCAFRDVDLETATALVQPIDLRIIRHDRREASEARADETCAVAGGKLVCRSGVSSLTWRAWIVPEDIAARAGAASLEAALASGLPVHEASVRGDR